MVIELLRSEHGDRALTYAHSYLLTIDQPGLGLGVMNDGEICLIA